MRYLLKSDRTPKWTLQIFLILVGVLMLLSEPVQSQQEGLEQTPTGKCSLSEQELDSLINLLNNIEQQPNSAESNTDYEEVLDGTLDAESARCAQELKKLREAISELQGSYYYFKQSLSSFNERWYKYWHDRYVEHKQQFTAKLGNVVKQIRSQDQLQSKKLRDKFNAVEKQLNETASKIAMQRQQI